MSANNIFCLSFVAIVVASVVVLVVVVVVVVVFVVIVFVVIVVSLPHTRKKREPTIHACAIRLSS